MRCATLQQICVVWELLKPRALAVQDGFAALSGPREASVRLCVGHAGTAGAATVRLHLAPLWRLQQNLDEVHRWAEALGLLPHLQHAGRAATETASVAGKASALCAGVRCDPLAAAVAALRVGSLLASSYLAAQYFMRYGPALHHASLELEEEEGLWLWWRGGLYALPYVTLVGLLAHDLRRTVAPRKKPTQAVYERFFGLRGSYYTWKVAALQLLTVCVQATGKLKLLSAMVSLALFLKSEFVFQLEMGFWCFLMLLLVNALYPCVLLLFPNSIARFAAASMDAFLDLGYTLTYLYIVLTALPALSSDEAIFGNFGDEDLRISNQLTQAFAFPSDALGFFAVHASLAHVLAVCRALERNARDAGDLDGVDWAKDPTWHGKTLSKRALAAGCYSTLAVLLLAWVWLGVSYPQRRPADFGCFPCTCPESLERFAFGELRAPQHPALQPVEPQQP